jgi:hypothetical protein
MLRRRNLERVALVGILEQHDYDVFALDDVIEASFPASDPPSFTPIIGTGGPHRF